MQAIVGDSRQLGMQLLSVLRIVALGRPRWRPVGSRDRALHDPDRGDRSVAEVTVDALDDPRRLVVEIESQARIHPHDERAPRFLPRGRLSGPGEPQGRGVLRELIAGNRRPPIENLALGEAMTLERRARNGLEVFIQPFHQWRGL